MPAVNFSREFAEAVRSGRKRQTIRQVRKRPIAVGDRLVLYTGQRTKQAERLGEAVCTSVEPIEIESYPSQSCMRFRGKWLTPVETRDFAEADGFGSVGDFFRWFRDRYGWRFLGVVIRWELADLRVWAEGHDFRRVDQ